MALQISKNLKGINQDWYIKVMHIKTENKGTAIATYGYFAAAGEAASVGNAVDLQNITFTSVAEKDIFEQAYESMKQTAEFSNATDC